MSTLLLRIIDNELEGVLDLHSTVFESQKKSHFWFTLLYIGIQK